MNNIKTVLSGIRPTSRLHIGNYFGAVKGMLELQNSNEYQTFYMVADLHALTTPFNPTDLKNGVNQVILDYLACGLDPQKSTLFIQSQVPEHTYFNTLLSSLISVAKLQHLPTYKEKVAQNPKGSTLALLNYPVLMAADILIYKATHVPVGKDQEPHLEVARQIAKKLNNEYKTNFPIPQTYSTPGNYIPSLTGEGKMAKSVDGSAIFLTDTLDEIKNKIAKIPTDLGKSEVVPTNGGVATLLTLIELFISKEYRLELEQKYTAQGLKYGELKQELSEKIATYLLPIQQKRAELEANPNYLKQVIQKGNIQASTFAKVAVDEVKASFGLKY